MKDFMEKEFNDTGLCIPDRHYMADRTRKIEDIIRLVERGKYFTINRPRQFGKTTILSEREEIMRGFLLFLLLGCVALFSCEGAPELTFEEDEDGISIIGEKSDFYFTAEAPWEVEGRIVMATHKGGMFEVFGGMFQLMWGDVAIELEPHADKKREEYFDELSEEAQEIIREQGCGARYLNEHSIMVIAVASNSEVDAALRSIEEGDDVFFEGYRVNLDSAEYKGNSLSMDTSDMLCVTNVVINEEEE